MNSIAHGDSLKAQTELIRKEKRRREEPWRCDCHSVDPARGRWVDFSLAMLNRNEFLYVP